MLADCLELLLLMVKDGKMSEDTVQGFLRKTRAGYERGGERDVAAALPDNYKAMLSILDDSEHMSWAKEVYYEQCFCGVIYRKTAAGDFSALQQCPRCQSPRRVHGLAGGQGGRGHGSGGDRRASAAPGRCLRALRTLLGCSRRAVSRPSPICGAPWPCESGGFCRLSSAAPPPAPPP